jgi:hypothetical protein
MMWMIGVALSLFVVFLTLIRRVQSVTIKPLGVRITFFPNSPGVRFKLRDRTHGDSA